MSSADQFRRNFTSKKRFRCHVCSWEGWLDETRLTYPSVSLVGSVPTMNGEEVDIPSILLKDDRKHPDADIPLQVPVTRNAEVPTPDLRLQPQARDKRSADPALDVSRAAESNNAALGAANGRAGNGSDTAAAAQELPAAEAVPFSTPVTPGFHHRSRHKAFACPSCDEYNLYRSRSRNLGEFLRKKFTNKRPYRCHSCGWRGWVIKGL